MLKRIFATILAPILAPLSAVSAIGVVATLAPAFADTYLPAVPPLSTTTGPVVAFLGDSITARGAFNSAGLSNNNIGFAGWISFLTNARVWAPPSNNFGVSGYTTAQILTEVPSALAVKPNVCVVMGGRNDAQAGTAAGPDTTAGTIEYNLRTIYDELQAANCVVVAVKILSQTFSEWPASSNEQIALQVNNWIEQQKLFRKGFYAVDPGSVYDDPTNTTHWQPRTGYIDTTDNTHPTTWGAYAIANLIAQTFNQIWPNWRQPISNVDDVFNTTANPYGNLLPNQMFTGTGGGFSGGGTTSGAVASGWTVYTNNMNGANVSASKTTWADGRPAQTITLCPSSCAGAVTGSNGSVQLEISLNAANFNAGDTIECEVQASFGATTNIAAVNAYLQTEESGTYYYYGSLANSIATPETGYSLPTDTASGSPGVSSLSGILLTSRRTLAAAPTLANFWIEIEYVTPLSAATVAGTFQFASPSCRKVQPATP